MGFTTGLTSGVTLTLGIAYLTVLAHERNRQSQAVYLRSQTQLLNSIVDPEPLPAPPTRAEIARAERSNLVETAKDRWNGEIENAVRWVQHTDWSGVREDVESKIASLWGGGLEKSREGITELEERAKPRVQEAVDASRAAAEKGRKDAAVSVNRAAEKTIAGAEYAGGKARERVDHAGVKAKEAAVATKAAADRAAADAKAGADHAGALAHNAWDRAVDKSHALADEARTKAASTGGTVDAARGAVRNVISQGIEKGKELVGKAQEAVGLATEKIENVGGSTLAALAVEKALQERYEKPDGLKQTVEQALADRYKPIEQRDNTVLRGV